MKLELLNKLHVKKEFSCGNELLDSYIKNQAKQDFLRDLSVCYVLCEDEGNKVIGYYTLSSNTISRDDLPDELSRKLPPSYIKLPALLLGRLAVDESYKGRGFGKFLLLEAFKEAVELSKRIGILTVIVDPIDKDAEKFYSSFGFVLIPSNGKMFIPIKTIE